MDRFQFYYLIISRNGYLSEITKLREEERQQERGTTWCPDRVKTEAELKKKRKSVEWAVLMRHACTVRKDVVSLTVEQPAPEVALVLVAVFERDLVCG